MKKHLVTIECDQFLIDDDDLTVDLVISDTPMHIRGYYNCRVPMSSVKHHDYINCELPVAVGTVLMANGEQFVLVKARFGDSYWLNVRTGLAVVNDWLVERDWAVVYTPSSKKEETKASS